MPYHVGEKGSNGCGGYPVVEENGKVVGCHKSRAEADAHLQALYANVADAQKSSSVAPATPSFTPEPRWPGVGISMPNSHRMTYRSGIRSSYAKRPKNNRRGRSGDATGSSGSISSGGPAGSMG